VDPVEVIDHGLHPDVVAAHRVVAADVPQDVVREEGAHRVLVAGVVDLERATDRRDVAVFEHRPSVRGRACTVPGHANGAQGREGYRKQRMSDETSLTRVEPGGGHRWATT